MIFDKYFATATRDAAHPNGREPFDYQSRLAFHPESQSWLIEIPTGCGKTAAVVLAWLWNRVQQQRKDWPRRLVFCLPMRTLVEQTEKNVRDWLKNLGDLEWDGKPGTHSGKVGLHILMGGEEKTDWDIYPEHEAILIGTQDMLLSRALNRGYGMSRYRWPMHFGLLNNDALWVMDETQLLGPALWTSAQLDWMRHDRFRSLFPAPTWWMSATVGDEFLKTSDRMESKFPMPEIFELGDEPNAATKLAALEAADRRDFQLPGEIGLRGGNFSAPITDFGPDNSSTEPGPRSPQLCNVPWNILSTDFRSDNESFSCGEYPSLL